jgi:hypothetical protein
MVLAVHLLGLQALQRGVLAAATLIEAKEPVAAQTPAVALLARCAPGICLRTRSSELRFTSVQRHIGVIHPSNSPVPKFQR